MELRKYQQEAVDAVLNEFEKVRKTIVIMATGLGKTQIFSEIARRTKGNILVLAHRTELVKQARDRLTAITGEWIDVEQAYQRSYSARIVVASVQTLQRQARLDNFAADHFSLVVFDEVHHAVAKTYRRPIDYFSTAKVLGLTATADRFDGKGLGTIFESVAYRMDILEGINQQWLVPIVGKLVQVDSIDLSTINKVGADLNQGMLDVATVKAVEGVVQGILEHGEGRQGIVFFPGVTSAELACARMRFLNPSYRSEFLCATTGETERELIVRDFKAGKIRYLFNCMIATEGFDAPPVSLIACARPTLSRGLYTQMIGRGLRRYEGKSDCLVLDFCGNSGKYSLMSPIDVLGSSYTSEERERAKKLAKEKPTADQIALLNQARAELMKAAEMERARVAARVQKFDPFAILDIADAPKHVLGYGHKSMTAGQRMALSNMGIPDKVLADYGFKEASVLIDRLIDRRHKGLASYKQLKQIKARLGISVPNITKQSASTIMDRLAKAQWQPRLLSPDDRSKISALVKGQ